MLDIKSKNKGIQEFVKKNIGGGNSNLKFTYHQINIFVKLFISQYSKSRLKNQFLDYHKKDVTKECIEKFAKSTKYFINGGFAKLLTGNMEINKSDIIDTLSKAYENDLKSYFKIISRINLEYKHYLQNLCIKFGLKLSLELLD